MSADIPSLTLEVAPSSSKSKMEGLLSSIDATDLVPLLQCLGFVLQGMDKNDNLDELHKLLKNKEENAIKIEITCVKSGTKATLFKDGCSCKCPSDDAHSWNVSGCVQGNMSITKSNLVPTLSTTKSKTISTLLYKCIESIISTNVDTNNSLIILDELKQASGMAKQKSAENLKPDSNLSKITLGPSPPRGSSSPIPDLCKSLKNSKSSFEGNDKLTDVLKSIDKLVKQAIELAPITNMTFTKTPRTSDVQKISPLTTTRGSSQQNVTNIVIDAVQPNATPAIKTPKKQAVTTGAKKKGLVPPSRLNLLKYKRDGTSSSLGKTPTSSVVKDRPGKTLNLSAAKLKNALCADGTFQAKIKPRTPIFGSKIAMKK